MSKARVTETVFTIALERIEILQMDMACHLGAGSA